MQRFLILLLGMIVITRLLLWLMEWFLGMSLDGRPRIYVAAFGALLVSVVAGVQPLGFWTALGTTTLALAGWTILDLNNLKRSAPTDGAI